MPFAVASSLEGASEMEHNHGGLGERKRLFQEQS